MTVTAFFPFATVGVAELMDAWDFKSCRDFSRTGSIPVSGIEKPGTRKRVSLKRKPKARSLLFKLENAASAWTTEWSDATFLLGQKIGKKIIAR